MSSTLLATLAVVLLASPPAGEPETDDSAASSSWRQMISGGAQLNPLGLAVRYDASKNLGRGFRWGVFDNFQVYSNEVGVQLGWEMSPALIEAHIDAAVEPGFYLHASDVAQQNGTHSGLAAGGVRTLGWRGILRGQVNVNYRANRFWLYSRSTAMLRLRDFEEVDTFQGIRVRHERFLEQATAVMGRFAGAPPDTGKPGFWVYGEYTVGTIVGYGTRPNRISGGLVADQWPWAGAMLNVDVYYSYAPPPIDGPGGIFAYWFRF